MDDHRVCFVGDNYIAGVGDPEHLGWTGRLAARSHRAGRPLSAYNLGVRRQTSRDVSQRWLAECQQRLPEKADGRIVVSVGVNDAEHNQRIAGLDDLFGTGCREADVPYVSVFEPLQSSEIWTAEVQRGDGDHPAADGYQRLTDLGWPAWRNWINPEPTDLTATPGRDGARASAGRAFGCQHPSASSRSG